MSAMRILVTGASGFVGSYVLKAIRNHFGSHVTVIGTSRDGSNNGLVGVAEIWPLDVTNRDAALEVVGRCRPTHLLNLAAISAPAHSAAEPDLSWRVNFTGTLNLAEAILALAPECVLVQVSSGLVYGDSGHDGQSLDETALMSPVDEYGLSKASAELGLGLMKKRGLKYVRLRPFNHTGPGQSNQFVIPALAEQVARIENNHVEPIIRVGNISSRRDFLDVRDVVRAYFITLERAHDIPVGEILNIASGVARDVRSVLDILLSYSTKNIRVETDVSKVRVADIPILVGNATKMRGLLGWGPSIKFEQTVADVLHHARFRVA